MKFRNIATSETVNVSNLSMKDGRVFFSVRGKGCGTRFFNRNTCLVLDEEAENGTFLKCADGWELVKKETKARAPRKPKTSAPSDATSAKNEATSESAKKDASDTTSETPKKRESANTTNESAPANNPTSEADALVAAIRAIRGANSDMDEAKVEGVVMRVLQRFAADNKPAFEAIKKRVPAGKNEVFCGDFNEMADYIAAGKPVYMYGAAGCGKSHSAEQLAKRLGLDYYTQSQVLFAHDVKGYGDANGNYVETPFFKAFTKGGLFFIDEMDASAPEALVVLNTAIANRRYDFPVIGNVRAHENFRIIAAGNTALTGADIEYAARSVQDASTVNRFSFFEMKYEKTVELPVMAGGDSVLYAFICDLRDAIKRANISLVVSYRQTETLASELGTKYGRENALRRNVFGGREADEIRIIFGELKDKENVWAKAMQKLF